MQQWLKKVFYGVTPEHELQKPNPYKNPLNIVKTPSNKSSSLMPVQDYFRSILDGLEGYKKLTAIPEVQQGGIPVDVSFTFKDGVTLVPRGYGAFSLNNASECKMGLYGDGSYKPDQSIVRISFSYDLYERMKENRALATYFLQRALDYAKVETDKILKIDSSKTLYGTAYLDYNIGGRQEVLLENPSAAGYEIRFYTACRN